MAVSWWEWLIPAGIVAFSLLVALRRNPARTFRWGFWRSGWLAGFILAAGWLLWAADEGEEPVERRAMNVVAAAAVVFGASLHWWRYRRARGEDAARGRRRRNRRRHR